MVCITVSWNGLSRKARHLRLQPQLTSRSLGCLWSIPEEIWSPAAGCCHSLQQTSLWFFMRCWGEQPCNRYFSIIVISNHIPAVPPRSQPSSLPTGSVCTPMPTKIMDKGSSKQFLQKAKNRLLRTQTFFQHLLGDIGCSRQEESDWHLWCCSHASTGWERAWQTCIELYRNVGKHLRILYHGMAWLFLPVNGRSAHSI